MALRQQVMSKTVEANLQQAAQDNKYETRNNNNLGTEGKSSIFENQNLVTLMDSPNKEVRDMVRYRISRKHGPSGKKRAQIFNTMTYSPKKVGSKMNNVTDKSKDKTPDKKQLEYDDLIKRLH